MIQKVTRADFDHFVAAVKSAPAPSAALRASVASLQARKREANAVADLMASKRGYRLDPRIAQARP